VAGVRRRRAAQGVAAGRHAQRDHAPPAGEPVIRVYRLRTGRQDGQFRAGPAQNLAQVRHDGRRHVPVYGDFCHCGLVQFVPDDVLVPGLGQPQQLLVAVSQVVVLVGRNHPDRAADVRPRAHVLPQCPHLLAGPLLGHPAVHQIGHDVLLGERPLLPQPGMRQADARALQPHRVIRVGGNVHRLQAALAQQRGEQTAVLVLVGAVPGDLGRQVALGRRHQRSYPAVLPSSLRLVTGGNGAKQLERVVVIENLIKDRPWRKHSKSPSGQRLLASHAQARRAIWHHTERAIPAAACYGRPAGLAGPSACSAQAAKEVQPTCG
jgi:hypothetical protein